MSALQIYNTLARTKQIFTPITPGHVKMYVCGMTVYDFCHIGHARVLVVFDMVERWLRALGYQVTYVRNITDIDDKIIQRAQENRESITQLTERFIQAMDEDARALNVHIPTYQPRATEYIPQMQNLIARLQQNGLAYSSEEGDVHYAVREFTGYGKLSGKSLDRLRAGERVEVDLNKRDPLDFVLWKAAKASEPEEVKWDSPWGLGRPGWHIECSAMATALLGEQFDIHGGGADLQFPHHENEIAQSEGAQSKNASPHPFVNYWMHNGFVRINQEKMSKSLGNFFTVRDVLKRYDPEVVRFFILRVHYRSPLNYSDASLDDAKVALTRLYTALQMSAPEKSNVDLARLPVDWEEQYAKRFLEAMNDDFNTASAIAVLFELAAEINKKHSAALAQQLKNLASVLGLLERLPQEYLQSTGFAEDVSLDIDGLIAARSAAKSAKNFAEADRIRDELTAQGIILEDRANNTTEWRRA